VGLGIGVGIDDRRASVSGVAVSFLIWAIDVLAFCS
jgi:hypothetical protein